MYSTGPLGMILIIDDDINVTDLLKFNLGSEGFGVKVFADPADVMVTDYPDLCLIIADAMNLDYTGLDLCREMKSDSATAGVPFIICSDSDSEDCIIEAFDGGVDDYVVKPFSLREMVARVKAVLRRFPMDVEAKVVPPTASTEIVFGPTGLRVDTELQRVTGKNGMLIALTKTEYAILAFLIRNLGRFFSRNEIRAEVWRDDASVHERIVDTNISRLRKKLGETGGYIINRYGMGYAFVRDLN